MESLTSFTVSIGTSAGLFVIFYTTFRVLSCKRDFAVIFYPAKLLSGLRPPQDNYWSLKWVTDTWRTTEEELVNFAGLDAVCYLKMLLTCVWILGAVSLYCLPVLIPLCLTANGMENLDIFVSTTMSNKYTVTYIAFDAMSMANVPDGSSIIWYFAFGGLWVTCATIFFLQRAYRSVIALRARHLALEKPPLDNYAVLVRDVTVQWCGKVPEGLVDEEFRMRYGKAYERALLVPTLSQVHRAYQRLVAAQRRLQEAYNLWAWSKSKETPEGTRPQRLALCPWPPCQRVDSIDFYTQRVKERVDELRRAQERATEFSGVAVAFFNDPTVAAMAAKAIPGINSALWTMTQAPQPEDVAWDNVTMSIWNRGLRRALVWTLTWIMVVFYFIPIGFVAAFTTLNNLVYYFPFLESITENYLLRTFLEAYLPQLALLTFLAVLPFIVEFLTWFEGHPSKSQAVLAAAEKYYYFIIINVFLGVTISGGLLGILRSLSEMGVTFDTVTQLLGESLPKQSTFFITYIALKFLIFRGLELSGLVHIFTYWFKRLIFSRTEEGVRAAWFPGPLPYLWLVPNDLLIITLGLCYAVVAPMILPFALVYHAISWLVYKHQALTCYFPEYDSRGRFWPHMHDRVLFALLTSQLTLIGYLTLKDFAGTLFMIPLPLATIVYFQYSQAQFYPTYWAHWAPGHEPKYPPPSVDELLDAYTPAPLRPADEQPARLVQLPSVAAQLPRSSDVPSPSDTLDSSL